MSTLRVSNIEAKADVSSPTVDEKIKFTNSSGDVLFHLDGKTSGITTVGINTTGNTFTVNNTTGDISFSGSVTSSGVSTFTSDVSIADKIVHIGDTDTAIRFPAADTITAETGGTERLRITSAGNVGIGTDTGISGRVQIDATSGGRALTVNAPTNGTYITFETDNTAYADIGSETGVVGSGSADLCVLNARGARDLAFRTNYTERLRIKSDGNVGIKTTTPNNTLTVGDTIQPSYAPSTAGNYIEIARTSGADAGLLINKNTGQWLIGIDNSDGANAPLRFEYGAAGSAHPGFGAGTLGMIMKHNGNIGIGTDNPKAQTWRNGTALDVHGGSGSVVGNLHIGANRGDGVQTVGSLVFYDNTQDTNHKVISIIESDKTGSTSNQRGGTVSVYVKEDATVSNSAVESATFTKDGISFPSGKGIDFSASGIEASGTITNTNQLLDDYEEGLWSPRLVGSTSGEASGYNHRKAGYLKVGNLVHVYGYMQINNKGTITGNVRIADFPFATRGDTSYYHAPAFGWYTGMTGTTAYGLGLDMAAGNTLHTIVRGNGTTVASLTAGEIANNFGVEWAFTYRTS